MRPRKSVMQFARAMEDKLRENDWKGGWSGSAVGWSGSAVGWLMSRVHQEISELQHAIDKGAPVEEIRREAADVGNFCMMVAEQYRKPRS